MKKFFLLLITVAITSVNAQMYQATKDLTSDWKESSTTFNVVESQEPTNNFLLVNDLFLDDKY